MKIAVDIQTMLGQKTGFGFYVGNLVKNLKKIDQKNQYFFFKPNQEKKDLSAPQRFLWDQFKFPKMAKKNKVDLLHQPCFSAPVFYNGKIIVTVHDLIAIKYGKDIPFYSRQFFAKWMPFSYRKADKIIAISEHTKKDIIKLLKIPEEKITVIYEAADEDCIKITDKTKIQKVMSKYNIIGDYALHIGTINPRKNLSFLIEVYAELVKEYPNFKLVITGKKGWYYEGLFKLVDRLGLKKKIIFTGYIEDNEKSALYSQAKMFLFPSIYEGFGLPILEAMACGTPVISSNTSSMPEVVDNAGILLSPNNKFAWVKYSKKLLKDATLRKKMSIQSINRAKQFSWDKTARETLKVYNQVCNNESIR